MNITFKKAKLAHKDVIFEWLEEPHMKEFWDNSQKHKDDILNFINRNKKPYEGIFTYWIGSINNDPFCFILTSQMRAEQKDIPELHRAHLSKTGNTITIDFGIGNKKHLGKGLAAPTLEKLTQFIKEEVDPKVDTFIIDPNENNPRAIHVYNKAGFKHVGEYVVEKGTFKGQISKLMVKKYHEPRSN